MENFEYGNPTQIVFGRGRVKEIGELAIQYGKRALVVTGAKGGASDKPYFLIEQSLKEAGIEFRRFDGVRPNPTTEQVTRGADLAREFKADVVIGLGGGSAMDTAKAIAVEATHPKTAWEYNCHTDGPTEMTLPIIAVGTTAGTGSQVTPCAVITKTETKDKSAIWNRNIYPKVALVDPQLTDSMPPAVTAQTGFDAFCHNFEAYLSVNTNPLAETMALEAIRLITEFLPRVVIDGNDLEARDQMAWADTLGGLTNATAGVTLPHGLGMQIGGHCPHVTHGQALAVIYPQFTRYTRESAVKKFAVVGRIMNPDLEEKSDEEASCGCCEAIDFMLKKIGLWISMNDLNISDEELKEIADCGQVLGDYANNPRVATIPEMLEILKACRIRTE